MAPDPGRSRTFVGVLVLASLTVITLDARHETADSPVDSLRTAVGAVIGPLEETASQALEPVTNLPDYFGDVHELRQQNAALQDDNAELSAQLRAADANENRDAELTGIAEFADTSGFEIVPAQVVAMGPAQSFSRTVTIDAGSADGVVPDLTVINADGLVGRVISSTRTTATVLLIIDSESTIGGRLDDSMELGFLDGNGDVSGEGTLEMNLVDHTVSPQVGDAVVTWGSHNGAPYLPGVPVGSVVAVHSSPAELTQTAKIKPYADFSALDVLAVVTNPEDIARRTDIAGPARSTGSAKPAGGDR